jgi:hypothetical protein
MPLQIRRGLNAERTQIAPANGLVEGELLYVTDEKKLYIGTGSVGEHQGVVITGYTDSNAKDAAAQILTSGEHVGIGFAYDSGTKKLNATVDLSAFEGPIVADALKGSVFADDSSVLLDAIDKVLYGNVTGNVTGSLLGNLAGNVIGNVTGDVSGNVTGNLTGSVLGDLTGSVLGDLKGSVFGDNSTIIVNGIDNTITAETVFTQSIDAGLDILEFSTAAETIGTFVGLVTNPITSEIQIPAVSIYSSDGTIQTPINVGPGGLIGAYKVHGYYDGLYRYASAIITQWDATADFDKEFPKSIVTFSLGNNEDTQAVTASLSGDGTFSANVLQTGVYETTPDDTRPVGVKGMIVFNDTAGVFQGYNGTAWVNLSAP